MTRAEKKYLKSPGIGSPKTVEMVIISNGRVPPLAVPVDNKEKKSDIPTSELASQYEKLKRENSALMQENEAVKATSALHEKEWAKILEEKNQEINKLKRTVKYCVDYQNRLVSSLRKARKESYEAGKKEVYKVLETIFTDAQITVLMTGKRVQWSTDDIAAAVALHACSPKAYRFIRSKMKIPLPSEPTIRRWTAKIEVRPGVQEIIFQVLKKLAPTLSEKERLVHLCFDEIHLSKRAQYDPRSDSVIGPHLQAQVVMMRPLFGNWKQPIYFGFDEAMTKDLFMNITKKLYEIGFIVVSSVSDLGPSNQSFLRELGVYDTEQCSVPHPSNEELQIHFFADVPHMLKLLRNHLLDQGLRYNGASFGYDLLKTTIDYIRRYFNYPTIILKKIVKVLFHQIANFFNLNFITSYSNI